MSSIEIRPSSGASRHNLPQAREGSQRLKFNESTKIDVKSNAASNVAFGRMFVPRGSGETRHLTTLGPAPQFGGETARRRPKLFGLPLPTNVIPRIMLSILRLKLLFQKS